MEVNRQVNRGRVNYARVSHKSAPVVLFSKMRRDLKPLSPNISSGIGPFVETTSSKFPVMTKLLLQKRTPRAPQKHESKPLGVSAFAEVMLSAWRTRRKEVLHLTDQVNTLQQNAVKDKNQLHILNTLVCVKQKRNDELTKQIKEAKEEIARTKSSCESLTTTLIGLKAEKAFLEQQIKKRKQEFEGLTDVHKQTEAEFLSAMSQQQELRVNLANEKDKVVSLLSQKEELIRKMNEVSTETKLEQEAIGEQINEKEEAMKEATSRLKDLKAENTKLIEMTETLEKCIVNEVKLKKEIAMLQAKLIILQEQVEATTISRLRTYWHSSMSNLKSGLRYFHVVAFLALPALPPPQMKIYPYDFLVKALKKVTLRTPPLAETIENQNFIHLPFDIPNFH